MAASYSNADITHHFVWFPGAKYVLATSIRHAFIVRGHQQLSHLHQLNGRCMKTILVLMCCHIMAQMV